MDLVTTKFVVRNVVSFCVGGTVVQIIGNNVYPQSKLRKAEYAIGGTAMGLMITEHVGSYTDRWIDGIVNAIKKQEDPVVIYPA